MAVTIISEPVSSAISTVSNGFIWVVTSDLLAEDNFRYTFRILINNVEIGTKIVPSTGTNTAVDLQETLKPYIEQFIRFSDLTNVWDLTDVKTDDDNPAIIRVKVFVGDQYELNGNIITSELPAPITYITTRGFSELVSDFRYASRFGAPGNGQILRVIRGEKMFTQYNLGPFNISITLNIDWTTYDQFNQQLGTGTYVKVLSLSTNDENMAYIPVGTDNAVIPIADNVKRVLYNFKTTDPGSFDVELDVRITEPCSANPVTLMFKNKFFGWSQFTFDAINSRSVSKTRQNWESQTDGIHDVNVIGRSNFQLQSTYMKEDESTELQELFLSNEVYIIPDGIRVTVEQPALPIKTSQKDQVIQYPFRVKQSERIFRP